MGSLHKTTAIFIVATLAVIIGFSQRLTGSAGMVNAGFLSTRYSDGSVQESLPDSIQFGRGYTLIGAEGYYRNDHAILSLSAYMGIQGYQPSGEKLFERSLWTAHIGFGWIINRQNNLCIYPSVGLGATTISLTEYRQDPYDELRINHTVIPTVDISLHFDCLLLQGYSDTDAVNGVVLGLKTGYTAGTSSPAQIGGWYATISVGGLAFLKKKS